MLTFEISCEMIGCFFIKLVGDNSILAPVYLRAEDFVGNLADRACSRFEWRIGADKIKLYLVPDNMKAAISTGVPGSEALVLQEVVSLSPIENATLVGIANGSVLLAQAIE